MRLAFLILTIVVLSACGDDSEAEAERQALAACVQAGGTWAEGACTPPEPEPEPTRTDRLRDAATDRGVSEILNRFAPGDEK